MTSWRRWLLVACCLSFAATTGVRSQEEPQETPAEPVAESEDAIADPEPIPAAGTSAAKSPQFYFEFLEYRYDVHRRVLDRWQNLVRANRNALSPGTTTLKYYIGNEGFISVIEKKPGSEESSAASENARKLGAYALALENNDPVPFPESVSRVYPRGYFYQISLIVR